MPTTDVLIREAISSDFEFIADLMQNALEPYYGGDHRAHAKRIFDAHIAGGHDSIGFFSFEQRMLVAEVNGSLAGMIHLVGKRQSTYKISPLIVSPVFQSKIGLGSRLLEHAREYVRERQARQIYCTVAEQNIAATQFFMRKGFIKAGNSESHYKNGVTEAMLYSPMYATNDLEVLDKLHISVLPFDEEDAGLREQVSRLLLEKLPQSFDGITNEWVDALFDGYRRRRTADVNAKYKLIFIVLDGTKKVIGVSGATPKKGRPIKVMPFIAVNILAFEAMLIDIPHQLVPYGHKLYIHINPTAEETISLQRLNWKLDAAMPSAYLPDVVTQQWSLNIGETTMRTTRVKQRYFEMMKSGRKNLEVRVGYDSINRIRPGERILWLTHTDKMEMKVVAIRRYVTFEEMLKVEPYDRIVPDARSAGEVLLLLRQIYSPEKERLGVVVFELGK